MAAATTAPDVALQRSWFDNTSPPATGGVAPFDDSTPADLHVDRLTHEEPPQPDPSARARMAHLLEEITGWGIFPEASADRDYVSRLWAEDWDSPEDAVYDEE